MSANHDSKQGFKFLFENLYHMYQREKVEPFEAPEIVPVAGERPKGTPTNGQVLKFSDAHAPSVKIEEYRPVEFLRVPTKSAPPAVEDPAFESLKSNLNELQGLQSRLHFMLQELEELTASDSSHDDDE